MLLNDFSFFESLLFGKNLFFFLIDESMYHL